MRLRLLPLVAPLLAVSLASTRALAAEPPSPAAEVPAPQTALPAPLTISDPMLSPIPPAETVIRTWREALQLLRARSTDLRSAYDSVRLANATKRSALSPLLPQINAQASVARASSLTLSGQTLASTPYSSAAMQISATQTIFNYQQLYAFGTAGGVERSAQLSYDDMERTLALNVANALVGVVTAERLAEINRVGLRQAFEVQELTIKKNSLGAATGVDIVRAQQSVESARTMLVNGDETLRQAREALGIAVGTPIGVGVSPDVSLNELQADAAQICRPMKSIDERTDIQAARANLEVAKRRLNDAYWQFLPTISATAIASESSIISDVQIPPSKSWNIAGVLSIPIWDGGNRYGLVRYNEAAVDQARQTLEAAHRQGEIQVIQAKRSVTVAEDQLQVLARARALAVKNDEMTQFGYREGLGTSLELVAASEARRTAEINYAVQEFTLVKAKIAAILALANCKW